MKCDSQVGTCLLYRLKWQMMNKNQMLLVDAKSKKKNILYKIDSSRLYAITVILRI